LIKGTNKISNSFVLKENTDAPIASVSGKDITLATLLELIDANQFLQLPRLSSQDIFDQLCPCERS